MLLNIMKTETALKDGFKDKAIQEHMNGALNAALSIDKSGLKLAYHVAAIKPRLEGNVDGLPTKFEDFAEKKLGIKRSQAFNILAVGEHVVNVPSTDIYLDTWTYNNLFEECTIDGETDWEMLKKKAKSRKTLGTTKVLTIIRILNKYDIEYADIFAFLADSKNGAYTSTVKDFEKALTEPFNKKAIETTAKTEDAKTEEAKTEDAKTEDAKTEDAKTEDAKTVALPVDIVKNAYPVIARYAEESQELATLLHYLNGIKEVIQ